MAGGPARRKRSQHRAMGVLRRVSLTESEESSSSEEDSRALKKRERRAKRAGELAAARVTQTEEVEEEKPLKKKPKKKAGEEDEEEKETKPKKKAEAVGDDGPNPFRLFVGGIAWTVDEKQLKKYFAKCGEVADLHLLMDKETRSSKGIAFVTMANKAGYDKAIAFDGEEYAGRKLKVSKANSVGGKDCKGRGKDGKGKGKGKGKNEPGEKPDDCKVLRPVSLTESE
ncbi:unnamed protein product, partial [Polarella glacialis]